MPKCSIPDIPELESYDQCIGEYVKHRRDAIPFPGCDKEKISVDTVLRTKFQELGKGVDRRAWLVSKHCVLKLAHDINGSEANLVERNIWKTVTTSNNPLRKMLMPVYHVSKNGAYSIVPRVKIGKFRGMTEHKSHEKVAKMAWERKEQLRLEFQKLGLFCGDFGGSNVGMLEGRPVLIDYGFGFQRCKTGSLSKLNIPDYWGGGREEARTR